LARKKKYKFSKWLVIVALVVIALLVVQKVYNNYLFKHAEANLNVADRTLLNYRKDVEKVSKELDLPADYLLALIALECGGFKEVPSRFEKHIYKKLVKVRAGEIDNFEGIVPEDIINSDDAALKNLASSWGPFQLMGYQCFHLNIKIKELRGRKSVFYGAKWIKQVYGKSLQQKKYKDAFHLHNTGKKYPKIGPPRTHNRSYVPNGIKFMKKFKLAMAS